MNLAKFLLLEFCGVSPNPYNNYTKSTAIIDVRDERLTHNCGANFDSQTGKATVPLYTFNKNSAACYSIANPESYASNDFSKKIREIVTSQNSVIINTMQTVNIGESKAFVFTSFAQPVKTISFDALHSPDLFAAIHDAGLDITKLEYYFKKISATEAEATKVIVKAEIEDLYDFNYYSNANQLGFISGVWYAAAFQIGQGRGVDDYGKIFVIKCEIDSTFTKLTKTEYAQVPNGLPFKYELPTNYSYSVTW
jgi:hypothetical protein